MNIHELNERRAKADLLMRCLGMANQSTNIEDRLKADARFRLALDVSQRANEDYQRAISALSTDELIVLTKGIGN